MDTGLILPLAAAILGAILGSFINALSFRYNTGRSALKGRSRCMRCGHTLRALDLVPVLSYLLLGGKCRYCGSAVSIQYPLVELAGGALGFLVYMAHPGPLEFCFWLLVWMVLLFVVVYDMRHTIIPWSASLLLVLLALVYLVWSGHTGLFDFLAGPLLALPLFLFSLISAGRWMGWGDGVLELSLGLLLGLTAGLTALTLAFWIGAVVGVVLAALSKRVTIKSEIPFAPFLALGAAYAHFSHVDFFVYLPFLF